MIVTDKASASKNRISGATCRIAGAILTLLLWLPFVSAQTTAEEDSSGGMLLLLAIFAFVLLVVATIIFLAQRYRRCPPDKILVVYGRTSSAEASKCIHGGGVLVWPLIQDYAYIDLKPMTININLTNALSLQNIRINVPSTFTIGVSVVPAVMTNAAERLLGLTPQHIEDMAKEIIFGQLRLTVASLTIEQINQDRESFLDHIRTNVDTELQKVGLYLINVNITDIHDQDNYIENIGKRAIYQSEVEERKANSVTEIEKADAEKERDTQVAAAAAFREKGVKDAERDQRIYIAGQEAMSVRGENEARADIASSTADLAEQEAMAHERSEVAQRKADAIIQDAQYIAEDKRLRADDIVKETIIKEQIVISADAEAERLRRIARGEADAILARYEAEAAGIKQVLEAKAAGYEKLVNAAAGDPKAASTLLMVEKIETMVQAQVEAIRNLKIDKITVWDGGGGNGDGSSTSNFVSSLVHSLPPIHDVAKMAGVELPEYLGTIAEEPQSE